MNDADNRPAVVGQVERPVRPHEDGGAAFPVLPPQDTAAGVAAGYPFPEAGMTLRDYFAAHALAGLLVRNWSDPTTGLPPDNVHELWAAGAYATADAMLAFRAA